MSLEAKPDIVVDARGTAYPGPLITTQNAIEEIHSGQILEMLSSEINKKNEIANWVLTRGHEILEIKERPGYFTVLIKKRQ